MERTYQPNKRKRATTHGFRTHVWQSKNGRVLASLVVALKAVSASMPKECFCEDHKSRSELKGPLLMGKRAPKFLFCT